MSVLSEMMSGLFLGCVFSYVSSVVVLVFCVVLLSCVVVGICGVFFVSFVICVGSMWVVGCELSGMMVCV